MADGKKENIISLPNPHLRTRSRKIGVVDASTKKLIQNMIGSTLDWEDSRAHEVGVALAAIQIDVPLRVIIVRNNFEDKTDRSFKIFINPEITKYEGEVTEDHEGCLSIKDIYGKVPRYSKVRIKALNEKAQEVRIKAEGFLARVFQHEIDHTNGLVFIDHIKDKPEAFYRLSSDGELLPLNYGKDIINNESLWK